MDAMRKALTAISIIFFPLPVLACAYEWNLECRITGSTMPKSSHEGVVGMNISVCFNNRGYQVEELTRVNYVHPGPGGTFNLSPFDFFNTVTLRGKETDAMTGWSGVGARGNFVEKGRMMEGNISVPEGNTPPILSRTPFAWTSRDWRVEGVVQTTSKRLAGPLNSIEDNKNSLCDCMTDCMGGPR